MKYTWCLQNGDNGPMYLDTIYIELGLYKQFAFNKKKSRDRSPLQPEFTQPEQLVKA